MACESTWRERKKQKESTEKTKKKHEGRVEKKSEKASVLSSI